MNKQKTPLDKKIEDAWDGVYEGKLHVRDVRDAVKELKEELEELTFGWMSGGCDEVYCLERFNDTFKKHFGTLADEKHEGGNGNEC